MLLYPIYFSVAKGRTNTELREQFTLAEGASQGRAGFSTRRHASSRSSNAGSDAGYSSAGSSSTGRGRHCHRMIAVGVAGCCCMLPVPVLLHAHPHDAWTPVHGYRQCDSHSTRV